MIEFNKCVVGGRNYVAVTFENKTLAMLEKDGSSLVTYGARISFEHTGAILTKMKELQGEKSNQLSRLEYLQADLSAVIELRKSAVLRNDQIGKIQLGQRITSIKTEIEELQGENEESINDTDKSRHDEDWFLMRRTISNDQPN